MTREETILAVSKNFEEFFGKNPNFEIEPIYGELNKDIVCYKGEMQFAPKKNIRDFGILLRVKGFYTPPAPKGLLANVLYTKKTEQGYVAVPLTEYTNRIIVWVTL